MVDENKDGAQDTTDASSTADNLYGKTLTAEEQAAADKATADKTAADQAADDKKIANDKKVADQKTADAAKAGDKKPTVAELHDAAIAATEAWQANPADENLKKAAKDAVQKAKDAATGDKKVAPEKYELKLPEKSKLTADHIERIASEAKERGLSNEEAQAMLERDSVLRDEFDQANADELDVKATQWAKDAVNDREFGGTDFVKNSELAKRVFHKFGSPSFLEALEKSGLGNHPELIRFGVRIGKVMSDDQFATPGSQSGGNQQSVADRLYGDQKKS